MTQALDRPIIIGFADVAGSTRLYETIGDDLAKSLITELQQELAGIIADLGGHVQELIGDEIMFRFLDADSSVAAACSMQEASENFSARQGHSLALRIGLHCGPVILEQNRLFGDSVNCAARMTSLALGGQIIASGSVIDRLTPAKKHLARVFDEVKVKGKQQPLTTYDLIWKESDITSLHRPLTPTAQRIRSLLLCYGECRFNFDSSQNSLRIGRSPSCELVIDSDSVSRNHLLITVNRQRFVVTDTSTNGTYVYSQDGECFFLHREPLPLWGKGQIALGAPITSSNRQHVLDYEHT